jgi:hypothetical protein
VLLAFAEYHSLINKERWKHPKGSFENEFYKLLGNGDYGKISQGIEHRTVFNIRGEKIPLKPSKITNSHYAAHCTSIIRVALTTIINTIENWENCEVLHWTTDGLTFKYKLPIDKEYPNFEVNEKGEVKIEKSFQEFLPELYQELSKKSAIKLLIKAGENLGTKRDWITIKTFGDRFGCEQTRGNWLEWKGITQGLARGNISKKIVNNAEQFRHYSLSDEVQKVTINTLVSAQEMKKNGWDLVSRKKEIKDKKTGKFIKFEEIKKSINLGPDGKRKLLEDSINTQAFENFEEAFNERKIIEYVVKEKIRREPERIVFEKKKREYIPKGKKSLRVQGSRNLTIIRIVISVILQKNLNKNYIKYQKIVDLINKNYNCNLKIQQLKDWKRRRVLIKSLPKNKQVENIIDKIFELLEIDSDFKKELDNYLI